MLITALLLTAAMTVAPSPDGPTGEQDGVVATAPATTVDLGATAVPVAPPVVAAAQATDPHGLSTDEQIARWLTARTPVETRYEDQPLWRDDRQPHGEFSAGIGTGGYRDYAASVSLPLGDSGRLDLNIRQTENAYPYRYGYGAGYGYEPYFDDSGYAFPGAGKPGAVIEYEGRLARPDGPPWARHETRPQQPAAE